MRQFIRNLRSREWRTRTLMFGILGVVATGLALVMNLSFSWKSAVQAQTPAPTTPAPTTLTAKPVYLDRVVSLVNQYQTRTAEIVAKELRKLGYEVKTGIGKTGVVGILRNGSGRKNRHAVGAGAICQGGI